MSREATTGAGWGVYVDGLNFYAAVRSRPDVKWVDFTALARRLVPRSRTVNSIPAPADTGGSKRIQLTLPRSISATRNATQRFS